ncbi:coenzyme F420-0:L-glutamate ligase [Saccharopolyspora sp. K220]|uniref:coenzyme F420-0:L-glutamate ligase n=1 Tax=Saccharopolyspora soli TaxID=2926618 RepID=UPI001F58238B|nr:coenzyme F420-0:L-glutamate ligase [Saccharopolyspora soli]MCI2421146.1 coenzyme F420-0:L-glutamate ligase [Saccharopolyspora soli]
MTTSGYSVFGLEPFPTIAPGDCLVDAITTTLAATDQHLQDNDVVVIASKVVSIAENRHVDLTTITPSQAATALAEQTGKPAPLVQVIINESRAHFLATPRGPIIATHKLGYQLTSAGVDRDGTTGAWLLPADPDASARSLRDQLRTATGADIATVIADSDGRADRAGATVISIGSAGIAPLRITTHTEPSGKVKIQDETFTDLAAAAAGIVLGQRGRGVPVAILRGLTYHRSDEGVASMLHSRTTPVTG